MADFTSQHASATIDKALSAVVGATTGTNPSTLITAFPSTNTIPSWTSGGAPNHGTVANLFATPPAIGGTTPAAGAFTTLSATGDVSFTSAASRIALSLTRTSASAVAGTSLGILQAYNGGTRAAAVDFVSGGATDSGRIDVFTTPTGGSLTQRLSILSTGEVTIGTTATSGNAQAYFTKVYSAASGTDTGAFFNYGQSVATTGGFRGLYSSVAATHTTGTVTEIYSGYGLLTLSGVGGTTATAIAQRGSVTISAGHTATNAYAFYASVSNSGTATNGPWLFYGASSGVPSHLAGALRIGTTAATTGGTEIFRASGNTGTIIANFHRSSDNPSFIQMTNSTTGTDAGAGLVIGINGSEAGEIFLWEDQPIRFATGSSATERLRIDASKNVLYIGDDANANMTAGLTIKTSAGDEFIAVKSGAVAHGYTTGTEADTFYSVKASNINTGGTIVLSMMEDIALSTVYEVQAIGGQASPTKSTAGRSLVEVYASEHDGANALANITADGNIFGVRARVGGADVTRLILDEDGDMWLTGGLTLGGVAVPTTGTNCLAIGSGTEPTAVAADSLAIYSTDLSAGNTIPAIWTEGTAIYSAGTPAASTGSIAIKVNGTVYHFTVSTTAAS